MRVDPIEIQKAMDLGRGLPYALVRTLSEVSLGPAPEALALDELIEARFFGPQEEVRLFREEGALKAVRLVPEAGDVTLEERFALANPKFGGSIEFSSVLKDDEDGQYHIACTHLTGWKGGA